MSLKVRHATGLVAQSARYLNTNNLTKLAWRQVNVTLPPTSSHHHHHSAQLFANHRSIWAIILYSPCSLVPMFISANEFNTAVTKHQRTNTNRLLHCVSLFHYDIWLIVCIDTYNSLDSLRLLFVACWWDDFWIEFNSHLSIRRTTAPDYTKWISK